MMDFIVIQCIFLGVVIVCKVIICFVIFVFFLILFKSNNFGDQIIGIQFVCFVYYFKCFVNVIKIIICLVGGCVLFMKNVVKGFGFGIFIMVEKSYIIVVFGFWSSGYYICDESI